LFNENIKSKKKNIQALMKFAMMISTVSVRVTVKGIVHPK